MIGYGPAHYCLSKYSMHTIFSCYLLWLILETDVLYKKYKVNFKMILTYFKFGVKIMVSLIKTMKIGKVKPKGEKLS